MNKRTESAYLAKARHNLKNPVNAILGFSEMLIEDCEDEGFEDILPDLKKIHDSGKEILKIIEESLSDSNVELSGEKISEIGRKMEISLRTPINTVIGYSEMLQEDADDIELDTFSEDLDKIIKKVTSVLISIGKPYCNTLILTSILMVCSNVPFSKSPKTYKSKDAELEISDGVESASLMYFVMNPGFKFTKDFKPQQPTAVYAGKLVHADYDRESGKFKK